MCKGQKAGYDNARRDPTPEPIAIASDVPARAKAGSTTDTNANTAITCVTPIVSLLGQGSNGSVCGRSGGV